nr:hypothetical protein Q903MT_gene45 [Picea sitchensis]
MIFPPSLHEHSCRMSLCWPEMWVLLLMEPRYTNDRCGRLNPKVKDELGA